MSKRQKFQKRRVSLCLEDFLTRKLLFLKITFSHFWGNLKTIFDDQTILKNVKFAKDH